MVSIHHSQINIGGLIYWWSLTIDTVTSIIMILAIGLAVDYSAHIGHNFMTHDGDKTGNQLFLGLVHTATTTTILNSKNLVAM